MTRKKKRQKARRHQQKRTIRAVRERRDRRARRQRKPSPASFYPGHLPNLEALVQGMIEMESLADEPEFADFELGKHAAEIVADAIAGTDEEMTRLEEPGDEERMDRIIAAAKAEALATIITPAIKADIRHRLESLRHRLRRMGQKDRAASIAALTAALDLPAFPWAMFEPVRWAFDDLVRQTLGFAALHQAIAAAAGRPTQDVSPDEWQELLRDPEVMGRFEAQYEADELLQEVMNSEFERVEKALAQRFHSGQLDLTLFTEEELAIGIAWYEHELAKTEREWDDKDTETDELAHLTVKAGVDALSYLNTPARRQQWLKRLKQVRAEKGWSPDIEAGLSLFIDTLADPPPPDGPERLLLLAYIVELYKEDDRLSTGSDEVQAQVALIEQIKKRLQEGESPLP